MKTIKGILQGLYNSILYKIGWLTEHQNKVIKQREEQCATCPLRSGNFCSRHKMLQVKTNKKVMTKYRFYIDEYKIVRGCGCFLALKKFSNSPCPQNLWNSL